MMAGQRIRVRIPGTDALTKSKEVLRLSPNGLPVVRIWYPDGAREETVTDFVLAPHTTNPVNTSNAQAEDSLSAQG
jgi:hypothetical protein